jgi:hypothetical protein
MRFEKALCSDVFGRIDKAITIGAVAAIILGIVATASQAGDLSVQPTRLTLPARRAGCCRKLSRPRLGG